MLGGIAIIKTGYFGNMNVSVVYIDPRCTMFIVGLTKLFKLSQKQHIWYKIKIKHILSLGILEVYQELDSYNLFEKKHSAINIFLRYNN